MEEMVCKHCCYFVNDDGLPYCTMKDLYTTVSPDHVCDEKNIRNEFYFTEKKKES